MTSERELRWLRQVSTLCQKLASERRPGELFTLILDAAIELTEAERGYLVEVQGEKPDGGYRVKIRCARGFDQAALRGAAGDLSRTVVSRVLEEHRALVTTDEDADVLEVSSVAERKVRAIACAPMFLRGEPRGVLYLDHRFRDDPFTAADLPHLQTFANQGALALETAELLEDLESVRGELGDSLRELERIRSEGAPAQAATPTAVPHSRFGALVGGSAPMVALYEEIERAVRTWDPVLLVGESGTGKALVAREIHRRGAHTGLPLRVLGAQGLRLSDPGVIYIPELADTDDRTQASLIEFLRDPASREASTDQPRILVATQHDPRSLAADAKLRVDLLYRLDVLRITIPPLRQRGEDLFALAEYFAGQCGGSLRFTTHAKELLQAYSWPGNLRELDNEVRRLLARAKGPVSGVQLSQEIQEGRGVARAGGETISDVEKRMVEEALRACKGNKSRAARQLGIPRTTLYSLIQRYGL